MQRAQTVTPTPNLFRTVRTIVAVAVAAVILGAFALWGGTPENIGVFLIGVAILIGLFFAFGLATWHLLVRPLPAGQSVPAGQVLPVSIRRGLALLLAVGGIAVIVGAFWDEVWHRQYGVPFGDDFFWRPHLMLYFGFLVVIGLAFYGLLTLMRQGRGTFQQRFRANPVLGMLIIGGTFLMIMLPADPLWHNIYGEDLSAWNIPHLTVVLSFVMICLLALAMHMTTVPVREWRAPLRLNGTDFLPILTIAACLMIGFQFFTTEWDSEGDSLILQSRPEWLLPALIAGVALLFGILLVRTLRLPGAATVAGVLALVSRALLIALFNVPEMMLVNAWVIGLLPLLAVDVVAALKLRTSWQMSLAGAVGMIVALLALYPTYYFDFPISNVVVTAAAIILVSLGTGWVGAGFGDYLATANKQIEAETTTRASASAYVSLAIFAACLAFVVFFVTTAAPPI